MNELQKAINEAYKMISAIPVEGDHVEVMAAARGHLRRAYKLAASELMDADLKEAESDG